MLGRKNPDEEKGKAISTLFQIHRFGEHVKNCDQAHELEASYKCLQGDSSRLHKPWIRLYCPGGSGQGMCLLVDTGLTQNKES